MMQKTILFAVTVVMFFLAACAPSGATPSSEDIEGWSPYISVEAEEKLEEMVENITEWTKNDLKTAVDAINAPSATPERKLRTCIWVHEKLLFGVSGPGPQACYDFWGPNGTHR